MIFKWSYVPNIDTLKRGKRELRNEDWDMTTWE